MHRPEPALATPARPHDPWVFRSVLDGRARMLTVALHEDLWVAYDATDGRLTKAWTGGVDFDGAVYTSRHGPQPTTTGPAYLDAAAVSMWLLLDDAGSVLPTEARYLGYLRYGDDRVVLRYELSGEGGRRAIVTESPEYEAGPSGRPVLRRTFTYESGNARAIRSVDTSAVREGRATIDADREPWVTGAASGAYSVERTRPTVVRTAFTGSVAGDAFGNGGDR
jgi:hypothetical protein